MPDKGTAKYSKGLDLHVSFMLKRKIKILVQQKDNLKNQHTAVEITY